MKFPIKVSKFEKVSYGQFRADCGAADPDAILDGIKMPARAT